MTTADKSTDQDKSADAKAERDKGGMLGRGEETRRGERTGRGEMAGRGEGIGREEGLGEEVMKRRLRRHILAELFDEDEDPIDRIVQRRLRRGALSELFDGGPLERLRRRREVARALLADFTPRTDIFEQDGTLVIRAELPGVRREDVQIAVDDGDLVISGERTDDLTVDADAYYQEETAHGAFYRRIPLPEAAQMEQIKAEVKDGILEIRVPMPRRPKVALT